MKSYLMSPALLLVLSSLPVEAQVENFDTAYPLTPANKVLQELRMRTPEKKVALKLKGKIISSPGEYQVLDEPTVIRFYGSKRRRADDTVYGKSLYINQGFGGAVLY